jgi:DNA polymerase-3 subunit delta
MVITLTGTNHFLLKQELAMLVAAFVTEYGDMALEQLDGEEASFERLHESVQSLPFLSAKKLVVLRDPGKQKKFAEQINDVLADIAETNDVIIVESKLDKRLTYYKTLKKQTDFREFAELDIKGLARWAKVYAEQQGGRLAPGDATLLIDRIGPNQEALQHEIDKLLAYDPMITPESIILLTELLPQSTVFELLDAAFNGNAKRAAQLYEEQRALKVEPLAITAMLAWQLHMLALVKAGGTRTADDIARAAKLSPFAVRKSQQVTRRLTVERLRRLIRDLVTLDTKLKTTAVDADEALQLFLLKI